MTDEVKRIYCGSGMCPELGCAISGEWKGWIFFRHVDGQWVSAGKIPEISQLGEQSDSAEKRSPNGENNTPKATIALSDVAQILNNYSAILPGDILFQLQDQMEKKAQQ